MTISIRNALIGLVFVVLVVGLVPAGVLLDRTLVIALEQRVRDELMAAPLILRDRLDNQSAARMMHAQEVASVALAVAMQVGDSATAVAEATSVVAAFPGESPVVIGPDGSSWAGPVIPESVVESTRSGAVPVVVVQAADELGTVALAPVRVAERWAGAAGVWVPMSEGEAANLSALTRSDVLLVSPNGELGPYTGRAEPAMGLYALLAELPAAEELRELQVDRDRYLVIGASLPGGARVAFVRGLEEELALVPVLRAWGAGIIGLTLLAALFVGTWFAARIARPVGSLGEAASLVTHGRFDARVDHSRLTEVEQVATAFETMRDALALRIEELGAMNDELEDRQKRLGVLQAELVQRDRLAAASRLLAQLAHEVRNPVASVRNCLEVLRRRVSHDEEASELADLAIDELLRMHELAEQMLDFHRPQSVEGDCDASAVAEDVAAVVRMALRGRDVEVAVVAPEPVPTAMPPDALKQVLLNLVRNAEEAIGDRGRVEIRVAQSESDAKIEVMDDGPGIDEEHVSHVFDPFFTTKSEMRGVGLGLFTAAGLIRRYGGRIEASHRTETGGGGHLTIEVPLSVQAAAEVPA